MNDFEEKITEELHEEAADAAEETAETAEEEIGRASCRERV